jgi:hypothetical protein
MKNIEKHTEHADNPLFIQQLPNTGCGGELKLSASADDAPC